MIIITGAAGFIGSCIVQHFNQKGYKDIIIVDDFTQIRKRDNFTHKQYREQIERTVFLQWLAASEDTIECILHIGAKTDTTLFDIDTFNALNLDYTKTIWTLCAKKQIPLIYASSAATYGLGEHGYDDTHAIIPKLKPLNPYGDSKNDFDKWAIQQTNTPPHWYGLKFFNVYGPNEYHKGRMASVIFHAFHQIQDKGRVKLFKSHRPDYADGGQLRDFVYVKDVVSVIDYLFENKVNSGIYNLGSGIARSFNDLAAATFEALNQSVAIDFIDTPLDIRDKYQYFTEANMQKLILTGYKKDFYTLEKGIEDYVQNYLVTTKIY
jgi:ADP-L-glycero-D-manno-heptose 6-epimerase